MHQVSTDRLVPTNDEHIDRAHAPGHLLETSFYFAHYGISREFRAHLDLAI
jgi:hypothetical protein